MKVENEKIIATLTKINALEIKLKETIPEKEKLLNKFSKITTLEDWFKCCKRYAIKYPEDLTFQIDGTESYTQYEKIPPIIATFLSKEANNIKEAPDKEQVFVSNIKMTMFHNLNPSNISKQDESNRLLLS